VSEQKADLATPDMVRLKLNTDKLIK